MSNHPPPKQSQTNKKLQKRKFLPDSLESIFIMTYRSTGLGIYGAIIRFAGMPLEKVALYMNSARVSGSNQFSQAFKLAFTYETNNNCVASFKRPFKNTQSMNLSHYMSFLAPYRVVGPSSLLAWFLQYSVMGLVFQGCDSVLSSSLGVPRLPYGDQLMEDISNRTDESKVKSGVGIGNTTKICVKIIFAPVIAGTIESVIANRAEVQRYYGIPRLAQVESSLRWNFISRLCGPGFIANSSRNCIMSATSFVATPTLYRKFYPQEQKGQFSLFWFGLGMNIFGGNVLAISQQALWGRSLDYLIKNGSHSKAGKLSYTRNINYRAVINEGLQKDGISSFFTVPKWATRVLMNAPVQGTLPWFYNEILPLSENNFVRLVEFICFDVLAILKAN